ncbi:MAG TPA: hypothetical protein K8W06_04460 [Limosilactobacillus coleohominis]|nr:hypothetical protein [Limosilactobacillus coleohominis]
MMLLVRSQWIKSSLLVATLRVATNSSTADSTPKPAVQKQPDISNPSNDGVVGSKTGDQQGTPTTTPTNDGSKTEGQNA